MKDSRLRKLSKIFTTIVLLSLSACGSTPQMERPITLWVGAPERNAICKASLKSVAAWSGQSESNVSRVLTNREDAECVQADSEEFKKFGAMTWDDFGVNARYIETLIYQCKTWK